MIPCAPPRRHVRRAARAVDSSKEAILSDVKSVSDASGRQDATERLPHLPPRFTGPRPMATSIYFLLEAPALSTLHRIKSDEIWHFHAGTTLLISEIDGDSALTEHRLGLGPKRQPRKRSSAPTTGSAPTSSTLTPGP